MTGQSTEKAHIIRVAATCFAVSFALAFIAGFLVVVDA